tara:strand:+ start:1843 stop:2538 length:696 start_codon:yes stop_codon:yes gene_type:complete
MQEVVVVNEEILSLLNEALYFYHNRRDLPDYEKVFEPKVQSRREEYISEHYLKTIQNIGTGHSGFPTSVLAWTYKLVKSIKKSEDEENFQYSGYPVDIESANKWAELDSKLATALSVRHNALANLYPPGGYISWHNNANATSFNLIFTWSETGDGWFDYTDPNGKRVRCHDKANQWVCRYGMFGSYTDTKHPLVYHAAATDCWRMTLSYIFDKSETSAAVQEFIIDELTTP